MSTTRVNFMMPERLLAESEKLIEMGFYSNFSELVRESLREKITQYKGSIPSLGEDERKLFALIKKAEAEGLLIDEKEMAKHGLKL